MMEDVAEAGVCVGFSETARAVLFRILEQGDKALVDGNQGSSFVNEAETG
jgi:hypothetical protein